MQARRHSLVEAIVNMVVGYLFAVGSQIVIFPLFGLHVPLAVNFEMGLWFAITSIARSYLLRRIFTRRTE